MDRPDDLALLLDELVTAIQLRDESDPDSHDWTLDARVRHLERRLVVVHRASWSAARLQETSELEPELAGVN